MTTSMTRATRTRRRRKIAAIASAGLALGLAAVLSLAAWNDNEWVFGGVGPDGDGEGVGTSEFEVQQNAWETTPPSTSDTFADFESNPGDALIFDVDPTGLTPGTTIYAPVALATTADSVSGSLTLITPPVAASGETPDDTSNLLWDNLTYSVRVTDDAATAANCRTSFTTAGTEIISGATFNETAAPGSQSLSAARGNVQYYCFAITLPDNDTTQTLQGRLVFPAWRFNATSD
ncbi:MAG: hypothetical protein QM597_05045 [Aeromicrobium sp.]|uniref:hypothetical protein n=1 Tax=Aeromicrobium sp. TaxID=1871063 RepID=UPI0039E41850